MVLNNSIDYINNNGSSSYIYNDVDVVNDSHNNGNNNNINNFNSCDTCTVL